jgi:aldehyde:ferredoxin oxidoreductase
LDTGPVSGTGWGEARDEDERTFKKGAICMGDLRILRVNMREQSTEVETLPDDWLVIGGRGLIARIMNREVPPGCDPFGPENKLIFACGPLAGTNAPQLGRISVGAKSPLTLGIKESNAGGPAAQKLDRLGIRAIIVEEIPADDGLFLLEIDRNGARLVKADEFRGKKVFDLVEGLYGKYDGKPTIMGIGPAGERRYRGSSVFLTDMYGDPSRNAGRGGLGAVMGSKGLKAVVVDDRETSAPPLADKDGFRKNVQNWVNMIKKDVVCGLFATEGTPFTIASNSYQGTMPGDNYRTGRPRNFEKVTGEVTRRKVWERHGKMHACMPGCVVQCSIIYFDEDGNKTSAYEYEAVSMIGTNLGIADTDSVAQFKYICDDLGIDFIEIGSAIGVSGEAGKMTPGDPDSVLRLLHEIEQGSELGSILGNGVVATAEAFGIERVPAFKGQALPAHDPRAVKAMGVTYATSPQGADHTAGLCYKNPLDKDGQVLNSVRFQLRAAACDTFGYCLNSVPGRQASIYDFISNLINARFGIETSPDDVLEAAKQNLRDELAFNRGAEFISAHGPFPQFLREEALPPTGHVFDVEETEMSRIWDMMEVYREPEKAWEVRFPKQPQFLFGAGVYKSLGSRVSRLGVAKAMIIADPIMQKLGRTDEFQDLLKSRKVESAVYTQVEPDPPVDSIERAADFYREQGCDGLIALGGGSSIDTTKATAVRVSQKGLLREFENMVGGKAKIKPPLPPIVAVPTTSGTGSETNQYAIITDPVRDVKFTMMSDYMIPKLAVIDPLICKTMPPAITAETGIDALSHCIEGYVGMNDEYHPYYEALALYGIKLIGRSLRRAYADGEDIDARKDMCMAAAFGGISFTKGLALGHAVSHVLGAYYHISHGTGCALGLLCHVRSNSKICREQFEDLAWVLDRSTDLEASLIKLYTELNIPLRIRDVGVREEDLDRIAFEASTNTVNLAANPQPMTEQSIGKLLREFY